jgi:hypothetical protein
MWMPHSDGLYSPTDSPEPSLPDLFGSTMSAGSSIASVADGVAWAHIDDDSVETDSALVHVDMDGMVAGVCLCLISTTNSISRFFSLYTDCQPVLFKNRFCLSMEESSIACTAASSALDLGFSPACTERGQSRMRRPPVKSMGMECQYGTMLSYRHLRG